MELFINYWAEFLLTIVSGGIVFFIKLLYSREKALRDGIQSLLRDRLIHLYNQCVEEGYCQIYKKESFTSMYDSYHALGGNGTITKLYEKFMELPEDPENVDHKDDKHPPKK